MRFCHHTDTLFMYSVPYVKDVTFIFYQTNENFRISYGLMFFYPSTGR